MTHGHLSHMLSAEETAGGRSSDAGVKVQKHDKTDAIAATCLKWLRGDIKWAIPGTPKLLFAGAKY
jgi:hypothetical protein